MENLNQEIIGNIKQETENEDSCVLEQFTGEFVGDIKHEPERHFVFIMPDDPEPEVDEVKELKIVVRKFDREWKTKSVLFEKYVFCEKCNYSTKNSGHLHRHLKVCKILEKCEKCFLMSKSENVVECGFCDLKFDCLNCKRNHIAQDRCKGSTWHCTECEFRTLSKYCLKKHFQIHVIAKNCELKNYQQQHHHGIFSTEPGNEQVKEMKIVLWKFDRRFRNKSEMFDTYFVCGKCEYATKQTGSLKFHSKNCKILGKCEKCFLKGKLQNVEECGMCELKFDCVICKTNHQYEKHRKGLFWQCNKCDLKTLNKAQLECHFKTHVKKLSCETCNKKFAAPREFENHQQNHRHGIFATKPEIEYECQQCDRSFAIQKGVYDHVKQFHSKMTFHCDICGKISKTKLELQTHMRTHLRDICPVCKKTFSESRRKEHIERHSITAKFKCDVCERLYFNEKDLRYHKRNYHEIYEVQCDLCAKIFKNRLSLNKHMRLHLKNPCPICRKPISRTHLKKHTRMFHPSGEKFLACNIIYCKQRFRNFKELKKHQQIHIGIQRYKCLKCDYQVKGLQMIEYHMKRCTHKQKCA